MVALSLLQAAYCALCVKKTVRTSPSSIFGQMSFQSWLACSGQFAFGQGQLVLSKLTCMCQVYQIISESTQIRYRNDHLLSSHAKQLWLLRYHQPVPLRCACKRRRCSLTGSPSNHTDGSAEPPHSDSDNGFGWYIKQSCARLTKRTIGCNRSNCRCSHRLAVRPAQTLLRRRKRCTIELQIEN